jgi:hypothetical protein
MDTEHQIVGPRSAEREALDERVAKLHRDVAGEEPRPAYPLGEASYYPPNCVHGMNSFADPRYQLALARLRRG